MREQARRIWILAIAMALLLPCVTWARSKAQARAEFERAEDLRAELRQKPEDLRRPAEYLAAIRMYDRVVRSGPATSLAPDSAAAAGRLYSEMARIYGESKYARQAAEQYRFLIKQYPHSKAASEARRLLPEVEEQAAAGDQPRASRFRAGARERRAAGDEGRALNERPSELASASAPRERNGNSVSEPARTAELQPLVTPPEAGARISQVLSIRHWSTPSYTRVVIELDSACQYQAGRIMNPDRIFFDLHGAKLSTALRHQTISGDDGLLKRVRMAQNQVGIVRIVLEVGQVRDYSAFLLPNPYRLIVDINGTNAPARTRTATADRNTPGPAAKPAPIEVVEVRGKGVSAPPDSDEPKRGDPKRERARPVAETSASLKVRPRGESTDTMEPAEKIDIATVQSATPISSRPVFERVAPAAEAKQPPKSAGKLSRAPAKEPRDVAAVDTTPPLDVRDVRVAKPTSTGDRSLTRALGLKIGRIVIDAGHGGHDTGTIGPSGLMEKDLVLDVAKRLGTLIEDRLGGEVVYTRKDDTFIPLETRTAIANEKQADLFVSIHANSSRDRSARGIETYYLNFTTSQDALEVAARENAVSEKSVHELQDLVKKITLREKLEESREFAAQVQRALYTTMSRGNGSLRNRGVKQAPFVVLIGANMPSILAEISFVSNPSDERLLKRPEYRQKIAEALYKGIQKYAGSLSGVKVAHAPSIPPTE